MKKESAKCRHGFTLIEMLVVTGIMALFSLTVVGVFLATIRGGNKATLLQQVHQDGDFALEAMARSIRGARTVECVGDFSLTYDYGGTIVYSLVTDGTVTKVASNGAEFLTGDLTEASALSFNCIQGDIGNQVVTIQFTLTAGQASFQVQEKYAQDFATSVSTRTY